MKTKKLVSGLLVVTLLTAATFSSCGGGMLLL